MTVSFSPVFQGPLVEVDSAHVASVADTEGYIPFYVGSDMFPQFIQCALITKTDNSKVVVGHDKAYVEQALGITSE